MTNPPGVPEPSRWRRLGREPGLHFLVLGLLFFGLHAAVRGRSGRRGPEPIVVNAAAIESVRTELSRALGRMPTEPEMRVRIRQSIDDEVLYREALRRGLDRGDDAIRRRLVQRMAYMLHDPSENAPPDDRALSGFLRAHADRYGAPPRVSFRQVFFSRVLRHERADTDARAALRVLESGQQPEPAGDPMLLGAMMTARTDSGLAADFGADFARAIAAMPEGTWVGPIESHFGLHVVRVLRREPGGLLTLEQVRGRVVTEYLEAQRAGAMERSLRSLRARYPVRVDWPLAR